MILAKNTKHKKKKNLRLASVGFLVVIYIKRNFFGLRSDVTNEKKVNKIYKVRLYEVQPSCSHTIPPKKEKWREGTFRFSFFVRRVQLHMQLYCLGKQRALPPLLREKPA